MGRIVAIDYGRKRTGIAVTDNLHLVANALQTVPSHQVIEFLKTYSQHESLDCFVVGEPRTMNNQASESVVYIDPFIRELKKIFPTIPIERMDERFTSKMASQAIQQAGLKKKDRQNKALVDSVSAVIILQSWLEMKK
ncbi:MAG: Holliday junction resolvase RuvX [Bacteroidales bacterium]|nr:Holliday junction resolvase RuvX [Bacteroidales bacterium]MDZ4204105.1 Holliday junction resolvase RuvX [Bacteroidales bacterium]